MNKTIVLVCVALFGAVLAQQNIPEPTFDGESPTFVTLNVNGSLNANSSATNQSICDTHNVSMVYEFNGDRMVYNVTLYRLNCNSSRLINFTIPVQNITVIRNSFADGRLTFISNSTYGDRFLAVQGNHSIYITIVPYGTFNSAQEEILGSLLRNMMMISRDNQTEPGSNHSKSLKGLLIGRDALSNENITFYPGWNGYLKEKINQTLIPGPNSTLKTMNVTVTPGWHSYKYTRIVLVYLEDLNTTQYVTIDVTGQNITEPTVPGITNPRYFNATILPQMNQSFKMQNITLYPGWNGTLTGPSNQTLIPDSSNSSFAVQKVIVLPRWYDFKADEGVRAIVNFSNYTEQVSIFFENEAPRIQADPRVYLNASLISSHHETINFLRETALLYPGWNKPITHRINQTLIASEGAFFKTQNVTVSPGWTLIGPEEGVRAIVNLNYTMDYVTLFFQTPNQTVSGIQYLFN